MKLSNIEMQKIGKRTLALVLAGALTFSSASMALANETGEQSEGYETVDLTEVQDTNTETETTVEETATSEQPSLVPGDFFYFIKIAIEKVKLALTFDQVKEAELLATYASERIAEAEVLLAEGKEEEALETIKNALDYIQNAETSVEEDTDSTDETTTEDETSTEEETTEDEVVTEDEEVVEETPVDEVEVLLTQNIISLKANMEKIKNPKAKAALKRNIERAYAKLGLVYEEETEEVVEVEETEEVVDAETDTVETNPESELEGTDSEEDVVVAPVKEAAKQQKIVAKQEAKQKREAAKEARKAEKQQEKGKGHGQEKKNNGKNDN